MLEIGNWVTQYRNGFWQIVEIKPKYAEENYTFEDGSSQKKGELIGSWILLKKGFTPKMKFRLDFDICDSLWCRKVSPDVSLSIEQYFKDNPDEYEKFSDAPYVDKPAVCTSWVNLTTEQATLFRDLLYDFPPLFTREYAMKVFEKHGLKECFSKPPANYTFTCRHTLWELDDDFDPLYKSPELSAY